MQVVVKSLEQTFAQIHVSNRVDAFGILYRAWELTISMTPRVFNALHMPLIDEDDDTLALGLVYLLEKAFIALVD